MKLAYADCCLSSSFHLWTCDCPKFNGKNFIEKDTPSEPTPVANIFYFKSVWNLKWPQLDANWIVQPVRVNNPRWGNNILHVQPFIRTRFHEATEMLLVDTKQNIQNFSINSTVIFLACSSRRFESAMKWKKKKGGKKLSQKVWKETKLLLVLTSRLLFSISNSTT